MEGTYREIPEALGAGALFRPDTISNPAIFPSQTRWVQGGLVLTPLTSQRGVRPSLVGYSVVQLVTWLYPERLANQCAMAYISSGRAGQFILVRLSYQPL